MVPWLVDQEAQFGGWVSPEIAVTATQALLAEVSLKWVVLQAQHCPAVVDSAAHPVIEMVVHPVAEEPVSFWNPASQRVQDLLLPDSVHLTHFFWQVLVTVEVIADPTRAISIIVAIVFIFEIFL
jgi:hypothetical protein